MKAEFYTEIHVLDRLLEQILKWYRPMSFPSEAKKPHPPMPPLPFADNYPQSAHNHFITAFRILPVPGVSALAG
jgi:hypothetical protein